MSTVILSLQSLESTLADFATTWKSGKPEEEARIGFASWELMHRVLSPRRLEIIRVMTGAGPLGMREIARRVGRDFKAVHSDLALLLESGVVVRATGGGLEFPYDRIRVDFEIPAAA